MRKNKLLIPSLSLIATSAIAFPLVSCNNETTTFYKVNIHGPIDDQTTIDAKNVAPLAALQANISWLNRYHIIDTIQITVGGKVLTETTDAEEHDFTLDRAGGHLFIKQGVITGDVYIDVTYKQNPNYAPVTVIDHGSLHGFDLIYKPYANIGEVYQEKITWTNSDKKKLWAKDVAVIMKDDYGQTHSLQEGDDYCWTQSMENGDGVNIIFTCNQDMVQNVTGPIQIHLTLVETPYSNGVDLGIYTPEFVYAPNFPYPGPKQILNYGALHNAQKITIPADTKVSFQVNIHELLQHLPNFSLTGHELAIMITTDPTDETVIENGIDISEDTYNKIGGLIMCNSGYMYAEGLGPDEYKCVARIGSQMGQIYDNPGSICGYIQLPETVADAYDCVFGMIQ